MQSGPSGHEITLRNIKIHWKSVCSARARFTRSRDRPGKRGLKVIVILLFRDRKHRDGPMRETVETLVEFQPF